MWYHALILFLKIHTQILPKKKKYIHKLSRKYDWSGPKKKKIGRVSKISYLVRYKLIKVH